MLVNRSKTDKVKILAWSVYDLANTLYAINIISLYFALWAINEKGADDAMYGNVHSISMFVVFLIAPILGSLSDKLNRRMPFLIFTTASCGFMTLFLGNDEVIISLIIFGIANILFQSSLIFYDALLPSIAGEGNVGKVGGIGIGIGYLGSFVGIGLGVFFLDDVGYEGIFRLTAVLYFLFAIPCFIFVRDADPNKIKVSFDIVRDALRQTLITIKKASKIRELRAFLIARLFYVDAINTLSLFTGVYVTNDIGLTQYEVQWALLMAIGASMVSALFWGYMVDRFGPRMILKICLSIWVVVFILIYSIPVFDLPILYFWIAINLGGVAMGATWSADRPYLIILAPPELLGGFFGLYSMIGRFASVVGPFMWGLTSHTLGLGRPVSVLVLLSFILFAFFLVTKYGRDPRDAKQ
ncbi:MAG: MFS transporter [Dehalococcoidia bacterium]